MEDLLTIGEMANLNNISTQTLRLYDRIGLLSPYSVDEVTGYRYYHIKQSATLDMIQYMKALGMQLKQIKKQLGRHDIDALENMLERQHTLIEEKIWQFNQMRNAVARSLENYKRYRSSPREGVVVIEHIPQRKVYCYDCGINIYDYGLETYEYILRKLKNHIQLKRLPMVYFCNVGSILRKKVMDAGKFESTEIFLFVDDDFKADSGIEIIPSDTFACIYCESFWKEKQHAHRLLEHIKEKHYTIKGDYICEVVTELPVFPQDERNMFIKLQIPIAFH